MRTSTARIARFLIIVSSMAPAQSRAHQNTRAVVELRVRGHEVELDLRATAFDLAPLLEVGAGVRPIPELFHLKREVVLRNAAAYLTLRLEGGPLCHLRGKELRRADTNAVELRFSYYCARRPDGLELRYDLLFDDDGMHRAFVAAPDEPGRPRGVLTAGERSFALRWQVSVWQHAASYLRLGVEHIFTGNDHLCFLLGLLLCAAASPTGGRRRLLGLLAIVTAFTVAQSLTLIPAALAQLRIPARVVEPAIAISVLYVGVENLLRPEPRWRWLVVFAFGLVHGFGFSHLLREVGLPQRGLLLSIFAFGAGVEIAQIVIAGVLFPVLLFVLGGPGRLRGIVYRGGSLLIAILGLAWTVMRLRGR
jgi:hypothetical protein